MNSETRLRLEQFKEAVATIWYKVTMTLLVVWNKMYKIAIAAIILGIEYSFIAKFEQNITALEIRFWLTNFFIVLLILVGAVARLYNAMVQNTKSNLQVKKELASFSIALKKHIKEFQQISQKTNTAVELFTKALKAFSETVRAFYESNYSKK
jgi:hypothetical protein